MVDLFLDFSHGFYLSFSSLLLLCFFLVYFFSTITASVPFISFFFFLIVMFFHMFFYCLLYIYIHYDVLFLLFQYTGSLLVISIYVWLGL